MTAKILAMNNGNRNVADKMMKLETLIANIEYLLMMPGVTEAQKQRLRPLLVEAQAELMMTYDIFEAPRCA